MMIDLVFNSPEEEVDFEPINKHQLTLFFKRDDLIHPFISGNKWRKLKYNLLKAKAAKKTHLVTFGGAFSNHILATAAAGAKFNFKTTALIRGEEADNQILGLCRIFGMHLIFVSREAYKNKERLYQQYFKNESQTFFIDEGGYGEDAEKGCREIISELENSYDYLFCAAGTGATAAGIINGANTTNVNTEINIVPALKGGDFLKPEIDKLLITPHPYNLHTEYHFGGYAKTKPALIDFIKDFSQKTGILLDPVYTGKVLFAINDLANQNYFKPQSKILMIHTGGLFGILGMLEKFR
ncbi:1-aminocyclopropane-1-carboxylate deaminase/D-cysteine desulfhydrase [Pedobacter arcticus]|uniref:1-aminocyclopropane-1-carboxylate deaminase/D-cysteine desulfhydrase n=1 Tax=Pedobacter arcticus TaxID=752140 RepID=UPI000311BB56|nr:pyridoxal-phosphate dependent enzyme [Pedobacter arcticus]